MNGYRYAYYPHLGLIPYETCKELYLSILADDKIKNKEEIFVKKAHSLEKNLKMRNNCKEHVVTVTKPVWGPIYSVIDFFKNGFNLP